MCSVYFVSNVIHRYMKCIVAEMPVCIQKWISDTRTCPAVNEQ